MNSFGDLIQKCSTCGVVDKLIKFNEFSLIQDEIHIVIKLLKELVSSNEELYRGWIIPSYVIFITLDNKEEENISKHSIINECYLYVCNSSLEKVIERYWDEYERPFSYILMNPITVDDNIDVDTCCAETLAQIIIHARYIYGKSWNREFLNFTLDSSSSAYNS